MVQGNRQALLYSGCIAGSFKWVNMLSSFI